MSTINQKRAFGFVQEQIASGKKVNITKALLKAGYAPGTVQATGNVTRTKGWKYLMSRIDDEPYLKRVHDISMDKGDNKTALKAIDMMLKLKDRYPAGKLKVDQYTSELDAISIHEADYIED